MTTSYLEQLMQDVPGKSSFRQFLMTTQDDKEQILRDLAAESMAVFRKKFAVSESDVIPLKSFEVVGAVAMDLKKGGSIDSTRFMDMVLYLIKTGIPVDPNFTVRATNLIDDVDYLETNTQADVTLVSYVLMAENHDNPGIKVVDLKSPSVDFMRAKYGVADARRRGATPQELQVLSGEANRMISHLGTVEKWRERLALSRSKLIFSIFGGREVDLAEVMPEGYRSLGSLDRYDALRDPTRVGDIGPMGNLNWQVIGEDKYIEAASFVARTHADPDTGKLKDPKKAGTQLGTGIHRVLTAIFEEQMAELDKEVSNDRPADHRKGPSSLKRNDEI